MSGFDIPIGRRSVRLDPVVEIRLRQGFLMALTLPRAIAGDDDPDIDIRVEAPWGGGRLKAGQREFLRSITQTWLGLAFREDRGRACIEAARVCFVREGLTVLASPSGALAGADEVTLDTPELLDGLERLGHALASRLPPRDPAVEEWQTRAPRSPSEMLAFEARSMGREPAEVRALGIEPARHVDELIYPDDIRAVARKVDAEVPAASVRLALQEIRAVPCHDTPELDRLSALASRELPGSKEDSDHAEGQAYARWLRKALDIGEDRRADIAGVLNQLGVEVRFVGLHGDGLDAVAAWGAYGPVVVVNRDGVHANSAAGTRATLAHELCHLLLDRELKLPVADVQGRSVRSSHGRLERRANAFAAEFLLPSLAAAKALRRSADLQACVGLLKRKYGVSSTVVLHQLDNYPIGPGAPTDGQRKAIGSALAKLTGDPRFKRQAGRTGATRPRPRRPDSPGRHGHPPRTKGIARPGGR